MNLKRRLERLEGGRQSPRSVFLTAYDTEGGQSEVARAVVVSGLRSASLERAAGETEASFMARVSTVEL
jgi:hypothetical protein